MATFLTEEQQRMFRRLLQGQLRELKGDAAKTVDEISDGNDAFADPSDRAAWESDSVRDLRIRDRERKLLDKIEEAIERLDEGTFGECEECGEPIPVGRLRARPVTTLCVECKAKEEVAEAKANHRS